MTRSLGDDPIPWGWPNEFLQMKMAALPLCANVMCFIYDTKYRSFARWFCMEWYLSRKYFQIENVFCCCMWDYFLFLFLVAMTATVRKGSIKFGCLQKCLKLKYKCTKTRRHKKIWKDFFSTLRFQILLINNRRSSNRSEKEIKLK